MSTPRTRLANVHDDLAKHASKHDELERRITDLSARHDQAQRAQRSQSSMFPSQGKGTGENPMVAFGLVGALQVVLAGCFFTSTLDLDNNLGSMTDRSSIYNFYVGVALMMFVGFGYLMTFLKGYGLGAVGFTMFITCVGVEFAMVAEAYMSKGALKLSFASLLNGNFAVAALLISFGGLIGKVNPLQITIFTVMELLMYCANKVFMLAQYKEPAYIADCGGTIIIHVFGAYFGLCACRVLGKPNDSKELNSSSYVSDLFSLIGTVFLWLYWPSFVAGALPSGDGQTTALINTVLALLSSTVVTFALTPILMDGKIGTVPIQNATLAGGVSIGATANIVGPFGAVVIGALAGAISTYGFVKAPFLSEVDTCGINNLHGMPGIFGGLVSIAVPFMYPSAAEKAHMVAANQAIGLAATIVFACVGGTATGFFMMEVGSPEVPFADDTFWECAAIPE